MYKPDDKDIDRLSRDAAEHYHAPGKPAWDALQQMLDKELPQEKEKKRRGFFFFFWLLLGLSVAGSGIWYGFKINHSNKSIVLTEKANTSQKLVTPQAAATSKDGLENNTTTPVGTGSDKTSSAAPLSNVSMRDLTNNTTTGTATAPAPQQIAAGNRTENKEKPLTVRSITKHINSQKTIDNPVAAVNNTHPAYTGEKIKNTADAEAAAIVAATDKKKNGYHKGSNTGLEDKLISATGSAHLTAKKNKYASFKGRVKNAPLAQKESVTAADDNVTSNTTNGDNNAVDKDTITAGSSTYKEPVAVQDTAVVNARPLLPKVIDQMPAAKKDSAVTAKTDKKKSSSKNEKAILLGLMAGIDESTVKFKYGSPAGYNFGFSAGYQFSKHWSVYTGIVYTKKAYKLNGVDYHPPASYWTTWVDLQTVDGYCRMWELPVTARYTFNPGAKTAFFANAGLSSYFMKQQQYNYTYKTGSGIMNSGWSDDKNLNHIFSILNLSAGFQKQMGKHMNWQIEPYTKIPLGGVGFGNIKLSSFGINLTVQYKHAVKR